MSEAMPTNEPDWVEVATVKDLRRRRTLVVDRPDGDIVVGWHEDRPFAMANICVHRERELARGMIFQGRLVCPGHQWAFDLETGYCAERDRSQPTYATKVVDDVVFVDVSGPGEVVDDPRGPDRDHHDG